MNKHWLALIGPKTTVSSIIRQNAARNVEISLSNKRPIGLSIKTYLFQGQIIDMQCQLKLDKYFGARRKVQNKCIYVVCALISCRVGLGGHLVLFSAVIYCFGRLTFLSIFLTFTTVFVIKSLQGPSFLPAGKASQVAKKNLSNIIAAKTVKVQSVLLMLAI